MKKFKLLRIVLLAAFIGLHAVCPVCQILPAYKILDNVHKEARRIALIVGIDHYKDDRIASQRTVGELQNLKSVLLGKYGYQSVYTLFNDQATSRKIYQQLDEILQEMGPDDSFFIYLAARFEEQKSSDEKYDRGFSKVTSRNTTSSEKRIYFVPYDGVFNEYYSMIDLAEIFKSIFRTPANKIFFGINDCLEIPAFYETQFYNNSREKKVLGSWLLTYNCHGAVKSITDSLGHIFVSVLNDPATAGAYSFTSDLVDNMLSKQLNKLEVEVVATKYNEGYTFNLPRQNIDQTIIKNLDRRNPEATRMQAIDDLVKFINGTTVNSRPKISEEAFINHLLPILSNADEAPAVQIKVIEAFPSLEYGQRAYYLYQALEQSRNFIVQEAAFNTIRKLPADESIQFVRRALELDEPRIRIAAIRALAGMADPQSLDRIIEIAVADKNEDVQIAALSSLTLYKNLSADGQTRLTQLLSITKSDRLLKESIRMLSKMKIAGINDEIGDILRTSTNTDIKEAATYALATLKDTSLVVERILSENLKQDSSRKVREASAFALAGYSGKNSESELLNTVKRRTELAPVRITAIYSLGKRESPHAVRDLVKLLSDENQQVRLAAVEALGEIGDDSALEYLHRLVKDENYYVREAAQVSISQIISKQDPAKKFKSIIQQLADTLSTIKIDALYSAASLGEPALTPYLIALIDDNNYNVRETAVQVLKNFNDPASLKLLNDTLFGSTTSDKSLIRAQAVRLLGMSGNESYVSSLVKATKDQNSIVRSAAAIALGKMELATVIDPLLNLTMDGDFDVRRAAAEGLAAQCIFLAKKSTDQLYELAEKVYHLLMQNLGETDPWTTWFDLVATHRESKENGITMKIISKLSQSAGTNPKYFYMKHGDAFQCVLKNNSSEEAFISLVDITGNGKINVLQSGYIGAKDSLLFTLKAFVPKGNEKGLDVFKLIVTPTRLDFQQLLGTLGKNDLRQFYIREYLRVGELITTSLKNIYKGPPDWQTLEAYLEIKAAPVSRDQ